MFKRNRDSGPPDRSTLPVSATDWSAIDSVRREWPASELNPDTDLAAWQSGRRVYDANDDYQSMMRAGALMCQALRHELYENGILAGSDLPETVHSVLFASVTAPPDGKTLTDQACRQIRLALMIMKKHGWQPVSMGGNGAMEVPFFQGGTYFLLTAAIAPKDTPWQGDLKDFFAKNPVDIPESAPASHPSPQEGSFDGAMAQVQRVTDIFEDAEAGDAASQAYRNAFAAQNRGDKEAALTYYEEAARLGLVDAMYDAGCIHNESGNISASTFWWETAAKSGHAKSAYNLAVTAFQAGDMPRARQWYQAAAELGDGRGYASLTQMASDAGDGQAQMHWSQLGAELGHPFCLMRYGQLLVQANPNDRTVVQRALALEERAAATGSADAMYLAGIIHLQLGSPSEARRWLERAEQAGQTSARSTVQKYGL
jgi:tetratricopeptide (TPR) repeat protein